MAFDAFANEDRSGPAVYVLKQSGKPGRYKLLERFSYLDRTRPDFHFVVPRDSIFRRSNEEDVGREVGDVHGCPVRQRVITGESDDNRLPPERLVHET